MLQRQQLCIIIIINIFATITAFCFINIPLVVPIDAFVVVYPNKSHECTTTIQSVTSRRRTAYKCECSFCNNRIIAQYNFRQFPFRRRYMTSSNQCIRIDDNQQQDADSNKDIKNDSDVAISPATTSSVAVTSHRRRDFVSFMMLLQQLIQYPTNAIASSSTSSSNNNVAIQTKVTENINTETNSTMLSASYIGSLLHVIPTFTIVDTEGIPYMVVGEDAKVSGYFFTSYPEAERILTLTKNSVDNSIRKERTSNNNNIGNNDDVTMNPWKSARISTVPLDIAVTLCIKGSYGNVRNYFYIAPTEQDIDDALLLTNKTDIPEGKVPLFYFTNFTLPSSSSSSSSSSSNEQIPLYFSKDQLIQSYIKEQQRQLPMQQQETNTVPDVQVTELFAVLTAMASTSTVISDNNNNNIDYQKLIFVPPINSAKYAIQCQKKYPNSNPFVFGKRNIVL